MRILRIRRGFTTNSSGANEYLPRRRDGGGPRPSKVAPVPGAPSGAPPPAHHSWSEVQKPPAPSSGGGWSGPQLLAVLGIGVVLVFLLDRLLRVVLRRRRQAKDEPPDEGEAT